MFALVALVALQSGNLNPGPYIDYEGQRAVSLWLPHIKEDASHGYASQLGVDVKQLRVLRNRIGARIVQPDLDHVPGITVEVLAKKLKSAAVDVCASAGVKSGTPLETFLIADGIANWVRSHIIYNDMLVPGKIAEQRGLTTDQEFKVRQQYWTPRTLLEKSKLHAVCAGYSRLTYHLARAVDVPLFNVMGYTRGALQVNGTHTKQPRNHSWNVMLLPGKLGTQLILSTDPTQSRISLAEARAANFDWYSPYSFPDNVDDSVFFHYSQYVTEVDELKDKLSSLQPLKLTEVQWREMGSIKVIDQYRSRVLRSTKTATSNVIPD